MADVGMVQRGDSAGFALEALAEALGGDFDGDLAAQARVAGAVNLAHPALADARQDFIGAEFVADRTPHMRNAASLHHQETNLLLSHGASGRYFLARQPSGRAARPAEPFHGLIFAVWVSFSK